MRKLLWIAGALLLSSTPAFAAETQQILSQVNVVGGAGFGSFTSSLGSNSAVGVGWDVRGGVVLSRYFGLEASYQGLSSSVHNVPIGNQFTSNSISADFVPGMPLVLADHELRPYALVGIGYAHVNGTNSTTGIVSAQGVDAATIPLGAGVSYQLAEGFMVDSRFTYNFMSTSQVANWGIGFNLGATFNP
jgi:opacity protein-like surface antigen